MKSFQLIIVMTKGDGIELWGGLPDICNAHPEFSLSYIRSLKFPFRYKGWYFRKIRYREKSK